MNREVEVGESYMKSHNLLEIKAYLHSYKLKLILHTLLKM